MTITDRDCATGRTRKRAGRLFMPPAAWWALLCAALLAAALAGAGCGSRPAPPPAVVDGSAPAAPEPSPEPSPGPSPTPSPALGPAPSPAPTISPAPSPSGAGTILEPADAPPLPDRGFFMGVLPIPADGQSFDDSYRQAALHAEFAPVWGRPTPFWGLAEDLAGEWGRLVVGGLMRANGMFPLVHLSFIGPDMSLAAPPGMAGATLADPAWRSAYKAAALDVVRACRPAYLSLGNEVNRWYEKYGAREGDGNGFQHFVSLYGEMYDAVKGLSPRTTVFCTFAREIVSENRPADLGVLRLFPSEKMDLLVFTTYPCAVQGIRRPADIPADYYSSALSFMAGKPIGFSEAGWPALDALGGPEAQAAFLTDLAGRLTRDQGVAVRLLGWPWLHDLEPGDTMGLIQRDGTPRPAYRVWAELSGAGR